jgi:Protein of unknown function (DUF3631)
MDFVQTFIPLSAAEHARFDSFILDIAREARGHAASDSSGNHRFGSKGGLCVYANGQFHDFTGGAREHGFNALQLIEHLYPDENAIAWARDWLVQHPGNGSFVAGDGEPADDFAEVEATAYIEGLYNGAAPIDDTPGCTYITKTRGLPLRPEDQARLRWVANDRGAEGALLAPVTNNDGKLVKLLVVYVTADGHKSQYEPSRTAIRGARRPGLYRLGTPGPNAVETEGLEKALAARATGADFVIVCGGASNLGKIPLPPIVQSVVIARDNDPPGSLSDQALWRGSVLRLGQGLKVGVTQRHNDIAPKDAPPLKDLDDVWRYDPALVPILLKGANLEHGRHGEAVDKAILDAASWLDAVALGRARKGVAALLMVGLGALDDALDRIANERKERKERGGVTGHSAPWDHPVTDIASVLDEATRIMKKHVAAPSTHFDTAALWSLHAHLIHREELGIDATPRLGLQSPEENSGKSTLMRCVRELVPRPQGTGSITSSSLFRAVDARKCTLLVDEADYAFRDDANPDLLAIFNSGNERTFAFATRSVPLGEGQFEDHNYSTFTGMCFTSIDKLATKSMQSRCISLPMKPATKEETAKLVRFRASKSQELKDCGRKFARWAADLPELPAVEPPDQFINRIADNWRSLFQIAHLSGGGWPARVLAAALADARGDAEGQAEQRGAGGLLDAIWRVLAAEKTDPRRIHTSDLIAKMMNIDEGRWRTANHGRAIDEYYLRSKLKDYVTLSNNVEGTKMPPRQWRSQGSPIPKWGYHELHFRDAFLRYLGKGLPSETPPSQVEDDEDESHEHPISSETPSKSATSATDDVSVDSSMGYPAADRVAVADGPSATGDSAHEADDVSRIGHPQPLHPFATSQDADKYDKRDDVADVADQKEIYREKNKEGERRVTRFPRGPVGRKVRKG